MVIRELGELFVSGAFGGSGVEIDLGVAKNSCESFTVSRDSYAGIVVEIVGESAKSAAGVSDVADLRALEIRLATAVCGCEAFAVGHPTHGIDDVVIGHEEHGGSPSSSV